MPGPAPTYRPTAPQAQAARAKLALLLHARPDLDTAAAARQLGRQVNWVFHWRRVWATEGFRLTAKPGRGRKPALPSGGGDCEDTRVRAARAA